MTDPNKWATASGPDIPPGKASQPASVRPVDVIGGPGNVYVAIAKREVAGQVGVAAAFAGPSEVVVIADDSVPVDYAAIDVILQAEHGPGGTVWLVTWDEGELRVRLDEGTVEHVPGQGSCR